MAQDGSHDRLDTTTGSPEALASWRNYLTSFDERVLPMFQSHGVDRNTAHILWSLNMLRVDIGGDLQELKDLLEDALA